MASYIQAVRPCFTSNHSPAGESAISSFLNPHSSPSAIPGSTGFLTDATGAVNELVEYTAWADVTNNHINLRRARAMATGCETWLEKNIQLTYNTNTVNIPKYMYTSKELDTRTHLYYFGARYYDPKTSLWVSTDPILGRYLDAGEKDMSSGGGHAGILDSKNMGLYTYCDSVEKVGGKEGVFNSKNLAMYTYCHQNPMIFIDPDGKETTIYFFKGDGGSHVAVGIDYGESGLPTIYDPGGNYYTGIAERPGDAIFTGVAGTKDSFLKFHKKIGDTGTLFTFNTTPEEEQQIYKNMIEAGNMGPFFCAIQSSGVVKGVGPFKDIDDKWLPSSFQKEIGKIEGGKIEKITFIDPDK